MEQLERYKKILPLQSVYYIFSEEFKQEMDKITEIGDTKKK